ncbi:hypothetical protein [Vibrio quintilis]|uniref:Uncharacterized protein n=1 Tax=Vibrio quintilis TaxID=1117707 RepID=A0A1M7YYR9_9VIBR|nr:hypothetical protein [Vibrio quintilis]SHO57770.1 hypothetical protein VQ7734_03540 [Vibrio quintilis]
MSLTKDIGEMVQAVDELTDEVSGKMGKIDSELVKFQNSFQPKLKSSMIRGFYFDGVNGDDSNDGTVHHPFKTFQAVKNHLVSGASYHFYINGTVELSGGVEFQNNTVFVFKQIKLSPAKIEQKVTGTTQSLNLSTGEKINYDTAGSISLRHSVIHFYGVDLETAKSKHYPIFYSNSFISRDDWGSGLVSIFGNLHEEISGIGMPTITINDGTFSTVATGPDLKNFTFYGAKFIKNGQGNLLNIDHSMCMIKINNSTFPEGQTCRDFIYGVRYDGNGIATNVLTNNQYLLNNKLTVKATS